MPVFCFMHYFMYSKISTIKNIFLFPFLFKTPTFQYANVKMMYILVLTLFTHIAVNMAFLCA